MMCERTVLHLLIGLSWSYGFVRADLQAADRPLKSLAAHLAESGIPTESEVALVERMAQGHCPRPEWQAVLAGLAGQLDRDRVALQLLLRQRAIFRKRQRVAVPTRRSPAGLRRRDAGLELAARQDGTEGDLAHQAIPGLSCGRYSAHLREFGGSKDTALVEDVRNLHLKLNHSQPGKTYTIHGAHGGRCGLDDFMPFSRAVPMESSRSRPSLTLLYQDFEKLEFGKSILKTPLRIGDRKFEHGLGTHANSRICVRSPKPIERFSAWIGVDHNERTRGGGGSVVFSVTTEDGRLFQSKVLRGGEAPVKVDLATKGAKTIDLYVDDAGDGPFCDHADWADAVVTFEGGESARLDDLATVPSDILQFGSQGSSSNQELPFYEHRDSRKPRRSGWFRLDRELAGPIRGSRAATGRSSRHAADEIPLASRGEGSRAARAAGLLERPATARTQHASPRALRALFAAVARRNAASAVGVGQYVFHVPRRRRIPGGGQRAVLAGAGAAVHRIGSRGLRDRRRILPRARVGRTSSPRRTIPTARSGFPAGFARLQSRWPRRAWPSDCGSCRRSLETWGIRKSGRSSWRWPTTTSRTKA